MLAAIKKSGENSVKQFTNFTRAKCFVFEEIQPLKENRAEKKRRNIFNFGIFLSKSPFRQIAEFCPKTNYSFSVTNLNWNWTGKIHLSASDASYKSRLRMLCVT
jgi:hypothetical protein